MIQSFRFKSVLLVDKDNEMLVAHKEGTIMYRINTGCSTPELEHLAREDEVDRVFCQTFSEKPAKARKGIRRFF